MPSMTEDQIQEKIADGTIYAITIDTSVFGAFGFNFSNPALMALSQFKIKSTKLVISDVVVREVKRHIQRSAKKSQENLKKAILEQSKCWNQSIELSKLPSELALTNDPGTVANLIVDEFLATVGAETLPVGAHRDISEELLSRYFNAHPPFVKEGKKKNEFPDGFALLSLEAIAKQKKKIILCISRDNDWKTFSDESDHLVCFNDLSVGLSYFNDARSRTASDSVSMWRQGLAKEFDREVARAIETKLDVNDFTPVEADRVDCIIDIADADLIDIDVGGVSDPIVIDESVDSVTFSVNIQATIEFHAWIIFFGKGGVKDGPVDLGSGYDSVKENIQFQVIITASTESASEPRVLNAVAELAQNRQHYVDFRKIRRSEDDDIGFPLVTNLPPHS